MNAPRKTLATVTASAILSATLTASGIATSERADPESQSPSVGLAGAEANPDDIQYEADGVRSADEVINHPAIKHQSRQQDVAYKIQELAIDAGHDGLVDTEISDDGVIVYWHGKVPTEVREFVEDAAVLVSVEPAAFSMKQLADTAELLIENPPQWVPDGIVSIGPASDYSSIEVTVDAPIAALHDGPRFTEDGIPLTFVAGSLDAEHVYNRWDDVEPFWGGAAIDRLVDPITRTYVYCTTAFRVRSTITGRDGMLSAEHCGAGYTWRTPRGDRVVGASGQSSRYLDAMVLGGATYGTGVYVGGPESTGGYHLRRVANPALNATVVPSGSWSGSSIARVVSTNQYLNVEGRTIGPGFLAVDVDGIAGVGPGDSGGPVVGFAPGVQEFTAHGLISAVVYRDSQGNHEGPCIGYTNNDRRCSSKSFHVNIRQIENEFFVNVVTAS
jgi:hypothetical protein